MSRRGTLSGCSSARYYEVEDRPDPTPPLAVRLAISWLTNALVLAVVAELLVDVTVKNFGSLLAATTVFGVLNTILKPLLRFVALPLAILTLGIAWFFVSMLMRDITDGIVGGLRDPRLLDRIAVFLPSRSPAASVQRRSVSAASSRCLRNSASSSESSSSSPSTFTVGVVSGTGEPGHLAQLLLQRVQLGHCGFSSVVPVGRESPLRRLPGPGRFRTPAGAGITDRRRVPTMDESRRAPERVGNVGTSLLEALADDAAVTEVVGIARRLPEHPMAKVEWRTADVAADDLRPLFDGADAVVHLAWAIQPSHDEAVMERTNVEGSRRVFAAVAAAGVPALVHASSVGAYSPGPKDEAVEESWATGGIVSSAYSRHKAAVERLLDADRAGERRASCSATAPRADLQGRGGERDPAPLPWPARPRLPGPAAADPGGAADAAADLSGGPQP